MLEVDLYFRIQILFKCYFIKKLLKQNLVVGSMTKKLYHKIGNFIICGVTVSLDLYLDYIFISKNKFLNIFFYSLVPCAKNRCRCSHCYPGPD